MHGRKVWYVVQYATEDEVIYQRVDWWAGHDEHGGYNEDPKVGRVVGAGEARTESADHEECSPGKEESGAPGLVFAGAISMGRLWWCRVIHRLVCMKGSRDEEQDDEDYRRSFVRCVVPHAAY